MRFNPLIAAIAGLFVIIAIPALVKDRHHGAGEDRRTEAQQRNAALPAPLTQAPSSSGNAQGAPCPGTEQSKYDCDTVSAIANVRQADAAERFNRLAIFEI